MNRLSWTLRNLVSQDVARSNAATAAARMLRRRRQREDVDDFLSQRHGPPARPRMARR